MSPAMPDWLEAYGPQLPLAPLVEVTNVLFHSIAADTYDVDHPEIHQQLPPLWAEMLGLLPAGRSWNVFDLGCGTGFEAELLLSHLVDQIASLTVFDPSPAMMARCRARLETKYPRVVYCSHLEQGCAGGPFNLLLTNSLLHHLPRMDRTLSALLPHLTPDALWLSGHEPSARFFRNQDCLRLLAEYHRFRRCARWLDPSAYLSRIKRLGKEGPLAATARLAFDQGLFLRRPSPGVIDRLVDFGVCRSENAVGPGMDPDLMSQQLQPDWELQWLKSYAFLGPFPVKDAPPGWAMKARALEQAFPYDGANFCTVWKRRPTSSLQPHSSPC
jgi:SAM-dependent methyltransferase